MLLNMIFRCKEILVYFLSCDPENQVAFRQVVTWVISNLFIKQLASFVFPGGLGRVLVFARKRG